MIPRISRTAPPSARLVKPSEESHYDGTEPVRGLPARLPAGESMLWQGAPSWRTLAISTFHVRKLAIYFAVLLTWDVISTLYDGETLASQAMPLLQLAGLGAIAIGLICGFCYAVSRTTVYTITSRRLVIRAGIAVPKTINVPYTRVASAGVKLHADGTGDILLTPLPEDRIAYLLLWPHCQAWKMAHARPMLRAVPEAAHVARMLGEAMAADGQGIATTPQAARPEMRHSAAGSVPAAA